MPKSTTCQKCNKTYKDRSGLRKHVLSGNCKPLPVTQTSLPPPVTQSASASPVSPSLTDDQMRQLMGFMFGSMGQYFSQFQGKSGVVGSTGSGSTSSGSTIPASTGFGLVGSNDANGVTGSGGSTQINNNLTNNQANNNLNVLCLTPKDDLLEMLTTRSTLKKALTYIKNCALSQLSGDCRLIRKIYLEVPKPALMYANKSKTQFVYYDENSNRTIETNARVIAKILAENVQRSYLKGSSSLKDEEGNLLIVKDDHPYLPKLDPHDLEMWNAHIYELNDEKYQKKVLNSLKIPFESDINSTQT